MTKMTSLYFLYLLSGIYKNQFCFPTPAASLELEWAGVGLNVFSIFWCELHLVFSFYSSDWILRSRSSWVLSRVIESGCLILCCMFGFGLWSNDPNPSVSLLAEILWFSMLHADLEFSLIRLRFWSAACSPSCVWWYPESCLSLLVINPLIWSRSDIRLASCWWSFDVVVCLFSHLPALNMRTWSVLPVIWSCANIVCAIHYRRTWLLVFCFLLGLHRLVLQRFLL